MLASRLAALAVPTVLLSVVLLLAGGPALSAAEADLAGQLAPLFAGKPVVGVREVERAAQRLAGGDQTAYLVVGLELVGTPRERIARFAALGERREAVAAQPGAFCSLMDAYALDGAPERAEALLPLLAANQLDEVGRADLESVRARVALVRQRLDEARRAAEAARSGLRQAAAVSSSPEGWRSRLVAWRVARIRTAIDAAAALDQGGPQYLAWLQADRAHSEKALAQVGVSAHGTLFGDAAVIEAARLRLNADDARECLKSLDDPAVAGGSLTSGPLTSGPLAVPALILRGDALLRIGGRAEQARAAYAAALTALRQPAALPELTPALRGKLLPDQPLHRLVGWGSPAWLARPEGAILAPGLEPWVAAHQRYQAVLRLAVLAFAGGDRATAQQLAQSLTTFDDLDRQMAQAGHGSGGMILANTFTTGQCVVPVATFQEAPPDALKRLLMGVAAYQVYDWNQASWWLTGVLDHGPALAPGARDGANALLAFSEYMANRFERALAVATGIKLAPGASPTLAWFRAHQVRFNIHQSNPQDYPAAMACMQEVVDQAPRSDFARQALHYQAGYSIAWDLPRAKRLYAQIRAAYPQDAEQCDAGLKLIEQRLAEGKHP